LDEELQRRSSFPPWETTKASQGFERKLQGRGNTVRRFDDDDDDGSDEDNNKEDDDLASL